MPDDNIIHFRPRPNIPTPPSGQRPPPMLNIPAATKILAGIFLLIQLTLTLLDFSILPQASGYAAMIGGFIPEKWTDIHQFVWWTPFSLLSFSFLHDGWMHLGVNLLMLVAIGSGLEKSLGIKKYLLIYFISTVFAALTHLAFSPFSPIPVIGASGGISGLFGALIVLMRTQNNASVSLGKAVLPVVMVWIGISVLVGFLGAPNGSPVAWMAHIGGFLAGLGLMITLLRRQK